MRPKLDKLAGRLGPNGATLVSLAITFLLGLLQYQLGTELSFSIFYVLPVALTAWYGGVLRAVVICGITTSVWLWADLNAGQAYSHAAIPVWNASVRLAFFMIITHLLVALRASFAREAALAQTDGLTGLANGRRFYEELGAEIARARRTGRAFTVAYMDADNFKTVNDRFGHAEGDRVLEEISGCLKRGTRAIDTPARLGGDEFAVLFPECGGDLAQQLLPRLRAALLETMAVHGWPVGFSVGVISVAAGAVTDADEAVQAADELMYQVKTSSKNEIRYEEIPRRYTPELPGAASQPAAGIPPVG